MALMVILLLSLLGLPLLNITVSSHTGVVTSTSRAKARYLAEMGAKYGYSILQQELQTNINKSIPTSADDVINKVKNDLSSKTSGTYMPDQNHPEEVYRFNITLNRGDLAYLIVGTIEGTGLIHPGSPNEVSAKMFIPIKITGIPEAFQFALAANSDVYLSGGWINIFDPFTNSLVQVNNGDIYAGRTLYLNRTKIPLIGTFRPKVENGRIGASQIIGLNAFDIFGVNNVPLDQSNIGNFLDGNYQLIRLPLVDVQPPDLSGKKNQVPPAHVLKGPYTIMGPLLFDSNAPVFAGDWYVDGNLTVWGNVKINGTFYVNGDVSIFGLNTNNSFPATIISSGSINFFFDQTYNQSTIDAFLWAKKDININVSNVQIRGGLIADNIHLGNDVGNLTFSNISITYDSSIVQNPPANVIMIKGWELQQSGNWNLKIT